MKAWLFLFVAVVCEISATSSLKPSEGFTKLAPSLLVIFGYGASFYFLSLTLKYIPVGIAYALWSGVGIILTSFIAWVLYGQKLDAWGVIGMSLIICGVIVLNLFSKTSMD